MTYEIIVVSFYLQLLNFVVFYNQQWVKITVIHTAHCYKCLFINNLQFYIVFSIYCITLKQSNLFKNNQRTVKQYFQFGANRTREKS